MAYRQVRGSAASLSPTSRPKVHLPAQSVLCLPEILSQPLAQCAKRTGLLMTDASHRMAKPTPQSVALYLPPFSHTGRPPSARMVFSLFCRQHHFSSFGKDLLVKQTDLKFQKLEIPSSSVLANTGPYCRFHLVCPGIKFGERNFFWAWYKLKLICVLYFHFVPSPEKVPHAKFFPERGGDKPSGIDNTFLVQKKNTGKIGLHLLRP